MIRNERLHYWNADQRLGCLLELFNRLGRKRFGTFTRAFTAVKAKKVTKTQ